MSADTPMEQCSTCKKYVELLLEHPIPTHDGWCTDCANACMNILGPFAESTDWETIHGLMRTYVKGEMNGNPRYWSPIPAEVRPLVPGLLRLMNYGFVIDLAQPSAHTIHQYINDGWVETRKRAYLSLLIPTQHERLSSAKIVKLIKTLLKNSDIYVTVHSEMFKYPAIHDVGNVHRVAPEEVEVRGLGPMARLTEFFMGSEGEDETRYLYKTRMTEALPPFVGQPVSLSCEDPIDYFHSHFRTTFPQRALAEEALSVTEVRKADTLEELAAATYDVRFRYAHNYVDIVDRPGVMGVYMVDEALARPASQAIVSELRPISIHIMARGWDRNVSLVDLMEKTCQDLKLPRHFAEN